MMAFLHRLLTRSGDWFARQFKRIRASKSRAATSSGSGAPAPQELSPGEVVTRLLYTKRHFSRVTKRPHPAAFDPSPYKELSAIHITGLSHAVVWEVAALALGDKPGRDRIYARADVPVDELVDQGLRAVRDDDPFARHTSVLGWPDLADLDQRKEQWKEICLALSQCRRVELVIPQSPIVRPTA
jgi:hypothetical protein